jgi:hypothetical protein
MNSRAGRHGVEGKAFVTALLVVIAVLVCVQFPQVNGQNQPQIWVQWQKMLRNNDGVIIGGSEGSDSGIITDVATLQVALLNIGDVSGNVTVTQKTTLPLIITPQSNQFTSNQHTVNFEITNSGFPNEEEHGNLLISVTSSNGTVILAQDEFFAIGPRPAQVQHNSLAATTSLLTTLLVSVGAVTVVFIADLILNKRSRRILTGKGLH